MPKLNPEDLAKAVDAVSEKYDADIIAYVGFLAEPEDARVLLACRQRKHKRKNVLMILSTPGGSADAAYRVARCLQRSYKTKSANLEERGAFYIYVHDMCKSAGTLLALGASCLIMSQRGELGPIDVQLLNEEEVGERRSGLVPRQAMETLSNESGENFFRMFRMMRSGGMQMPTRLAAETAAVMAIGMMEPIYAQLDPIRLGEIERFVNIAQQYGERLSTNNVRAGTIEKLLRSYPSHEFVIDREEAGELFERVDIPSDALELIAGTFIRLHHPTPDSMESFIQFLNAEPKPVVEKIDVEATGAGGVKAREDGLPPNRPTRSAASQSSRRNGSRPSESGSRSVEQDSSSVK